MATQSTPNNSTPSGTGSGGGLRDAAGSIAGMLSDDFTITDTGRNDDAPRSAQQPRQARTEQQPRKETAKSDDEPIVREDVERVDENGDIVFEPQGDEPELDANGDPIEAEPHEPEGDEHEPEGKLTDETKVTLAVGEGKTEEVTFGELKKGYLRAADYTRKTQAIAKESETITKDRTDLSAERASLTASIEAVGRFVKELLPQEPTEAQWAELRQNDPQGYAAAREEWRSFKEKLQGINVAWKNAQDGQQAELQRTIRDTAAKEKEKLVEAVPEWKDARVKKRDIADMFETAKALGFTDDDVRNTVDSRLMLLLRKAAKYDRLMAARKDLDKQRENQQNDTAKTQRRSMAPGSKPNLPTSKTAVTQARDQHHKAQNVRSAAGLLERLL